MGAPRPEHNQGDSDPSSSGDQPLGPQRCVGECQIGTSQARHGTPEKYGEETDQDDRISNRVCRFGRLPNRLDD